MKVTRIGLWNPPFGRLWSAHFTSPGATGGNEPRQRKNARPTKTREQFEPLNHAAYKGPAR